MKNYIFLSFLLLILISPLFAQEEMSITVRETQVRNNPSFLGKPTGTLVYGDRVLVLEEKNGWAFIHFADPNGEADREGWVHGSALTEKEIILADAGREVGTGADAREVALAGKGFNKEVEARYKSEYDLDFTWIDRMEAFGRTREELVTFLVAGELVSKEEVR